MLIVGDDAVEFLEQVENDIRLPFADLAAQCGQAVEHTKASYFGTPGTQMRDDIVFRAPLVNLLIGIALDTRRGQRSITTSMTTHQDRGEQRIRPSLDQLPLSQ